VVTIVINYSVQVARRIHRPSVQGRRSLTIASRLTVVVASESFFVDGKSHLLPGETDRAREWGARLAASLVSSGATDVDRPRRPPTSKET